MKLDIATYWERRHAHGPVNQGCVGRLGAFKAEVLNALVEDEGIDSVIEFGCGAGHQASLLTCNRYLGIDISPTAVARCRVRFENDPSKRFMRLTRYAGETAHLALSLDVVYHLVNDAAYHAHMASLFAAAERFVAIYSSNRTADDPGAPSWVRYPAPHVRHRRFTDWIEEHASSWELFQHIPSRYPYKGGPSSGRSYSDFYIYARESE